MANKATILLVEDNELNMQMAKDLLGIAGFDTLEAEDADTGINIAKSRHPDLVLMDMNMPVLDGYQATRMLKADPETHDIPVVAFTALAMEEEQRQAIQSGCSGVICKPIDVDGFAQTIQSYLDAAQPNSPAPTPVVPTPPSGPYSGLSKAPESVSEVPHPVNVSAEVSAADLEDFVYHVSHDLQGPLRKIRQLSNFLMESAKGELQPDNFTMLEAIERNGNQLYDLLADLLVLSRVGRIESAMTEFPVLAAIREAMQKNQAQIDVLHAEVELGHMAVLEGNFPQFVQLFSQMIQNSLKYRKKDQVPHIFIECREDEDSVEIVFQDNGIGFKSEYANQIFQPLQRLHGVSQYPGTGIGLAIVKKVVGRHHGSISVESQPEHGSTFVIRLPKKQRKEEIEVSPDKLVG